MKVSIVKKRASGAYWTGKKLPQWVKDKIKATKIRNGTVTANSDYFKNIKYVGEEHARWKGDKVGYVGLHTWIQRVKGSPDTCEFCKRGGLTGRQIHWANKSKKYKRTLDDWLRLCAKCHWHYDRE